MDTSSPVKGMALLVILMALSTLISALISAGGVYAQTPAPTTAPPQPGDYPDQPLSYDPAEAQAIDGMIMCPVCPAETIDQAQVPIARQMRALVREKLALGATRQEILDFFAERYGQGILAAPPKTGLNLVAWILPLAGVAAALVTGLLVLRSMSTRPANPIAPAPRVAGSEDDLGPYLAMVDQELARRQNFPVTGLVNPDGDTWESPVGSGGPRGVNPSGNSPGSESREQTQRESDR
jgi:cytochrome c-type biogenesis protein CcmH